MTSHEDVFDRCGTLKLYVTLDRMFSLTNFTVYYN